MNKKFIELNKLYKIDRVDFIEERLKRIKTLLEKKLPKKDYYQQMHTKYQEIMRLFCF